MPLNTPPISISPLDLNKNVAIGVVFPLMSGGTFGQSFTLTEQIKSNIINVLLTEKGERVNQPGLGAGLKKILFENNPSSSEIEELISQQLSIYVPEIEVDGIEVEFIENEHLLYIKLIYTFLLSQEQDSIQININQQPYGKNG